MLANKQHASLTLKEPTPEGTAFITIVEEEPGKVIQIFTHIGKAGSSVRAYTYAIDQLVTELFSRNTTISDVISLLSDISSDRSASLDGSSYNRSYAEALSNALKKYLSSLDVVPDGELKVARFTNK